MDLELQQQQRSSAADTTPQERGPLSVNEAALLPLSGLTENSRVKRRKTHKRHRQLSSR
jgi:hypothetical protein